MSTLIFLHIDRTGGMYVRKWLAQRFDYTAIRPVPHHRASRLQPHSYPLDHDADLNRQNSCYVHSGHKLVMGHWDAGILDKIPDPKQVLTVLRDPAERAASLWRYVCQETNLYGALSIEAQQVGMREWLLNHRALWVHAMFNQLSGARWSGKTHSYQMALKNIQDFDFVGITEKLNEFLFSLPIGGGGMGTTLATGLNGTVRKPLPAGIRAMVSRESPLDVELYGIAKVRCESELQQSHIG